MSMKKDYVWNSIAGLVNAAEAVIMSMIVTRVTGLTDAGILTIAFAVGNLLMTIGKYGMRTYQVTDLRPKYDFSEYFVSRVVTTSIMLVCTIVYIGYAIFAKNYDLYKCVSVFMICLIYVVESLEDIFWGHYHKEGFLAIGAKIFCLRWCIIIFSFAVTIIISKNLAFALLVSFALSVIVFFWAIKYTFSCVTHIAFRKSIRKKIMPSKVRGLLTATLPLFGTNFLSFYVLNSPKYAIDACLDSDVQACYGFVAMPVFVIGLLNSFIYQPTLVAMADEWEKGLIKKFGKRILKQCAILCVITVVCVLGAYIAGIPVLSWLYSTDLSQYKIELLVLLLAGGFLACSGYLNIILTTMRCQKYLFVGYIIIAIISFAGMRSIVTFYGTLGVAVSYCLLMLLLCCIYSGMVFFCWRRSFLYNTNIGNSKKEG